MSISYDLTLVTYNCDQIVRELKQANRGQRFEDRKSKWTGCDHICQMLRRFFQLIHAALHVPVLSNPSAKSWIRSVKTYFQLLVPLEEGEGN